MFDHRVTPSLLAIFACSVFVAPQVLFAQPSQESVDANGGFQILFDGKSLAQWEGDADLWSVQDGCIVGETNADSPIAANTFLIWKGGDVQDFEFRCLVRFEGNNSGVQYRSDALDGVEFGLKGYQADLHPRSDYLGMLYSEKTGRGILATAGRRVTLTNDQPMVIDDSLPPANADASEWNHLRIVAVGNRLIHQINGVTTVDVIDQSSKALLRGRLGLQLHRGPAMKVEFRNLMLRPFTKDEGKRRIEQLESRQSQTSAAADQSDELSVSEWLAQAPQPSWIWSETSQDNQTLWIATDFKLEGLSSSNPVHSARLYATCDNRCEIFLNNRQVAASRQWERPIIEDMDADRFETANEIVVSAGNEGGIAALILKLEVRLQDGTQVVVSSDNHWRVSPRTNEQSTPTLASVDNWNSANVIQPLGKGPWGIPGTERGAQSSKLLNPNNIVTPPGFEVELLHTVTQDQGSWVSLAFDPQGRVYACDQQGAGLYRIELDDYGVHAIEKVSVGSLARISGAQGLTWAFDSLWVHVNGGHLYRLRDSDGDDKLDVAEEIPSKTGGGEHGNHAVLPSDDGKSLYLLGGNHAPLIETSTSRVPTWSEGLLLPRMWDANGHARGVLAPGGWVTRLDPDSNEQSLLSIGYRNQYDAALNPLGDLFTYDADMEWDMGLPWYRPTRICFAASGSDYGWRSGSGKWPTYYEDTLPPVVEIGPGSPTGVVSGMGTKFPSRYQRAIFALDWTFGTMYAIHLESDGAGYRGEAEPFLYSSPLPLTDAVVGPDGALYFAVGGRGTQSALYRVTYVGDLSQNSNSEAPKLNAASQKRKLLETFHGRVDGQAVKTAWQFLNSPDRFLRHAARIAIESQPVENWLTAYREETDPQTIATLSVALARVGEQDHQPIIIERLLSLDLGRVSDQTALAALRGYALAFSELESPDAETRERVASQLLPLLPSENGNLNTELVRVLVYLRSPQVVPKAVDIMTQPNLDPLPAWSEIASRNSGYGSRILELLNNPPPTRQLGYAFMLRNMRDGWTLELRRKYFEFLNRAATAAGGSSYPGYLTRIRDESLASCSDEEREALEDLTGEDFNPQPDFPIQEPEGPGKEWNLAEVIRASSGSADFQRGRSLFFSAKCASCHRLAGLGGNIGPDLTGLRNKFDLGYLAEAVIDPSKNISDQYGSTRVLTTDGQVLTGLALEQENGDVLLYPIQADAEPILVERDDVEEMVPSPVSQMPVGLLNTLNASEIRDLMAYIMAAGNPDDRRFR